MEAIWERRFVEPLKVQVQVQEMTMVSRIKMIHQTMIKITEVIVVMKYSNRKCKDLSDFFKKS